MTRTILRANEFEPEKVIDVFKRFQEKARSQGNPVLLQGSALFAISPLLAVGKLSGDESDLLKATIALIPPVVFATVKQSTQGLSGKDHSYLNTVGGGNLDVHRKNVAEMRQKYKGDSEAERQISHYDGDSAYNAYLRAYRADLKEEIRRERDERNES